MVDILIQIKVKKKPSDRIYVTKKQDEIEEEEKDKEDFDIQYFSEEDNNNDLGIDGIYDEKYLIDDETNGKVMNREERREASRKNRKKKKVVLGFADTTTSDTSSTSELNSLE